MPSQGGKCAVKARQYPKVCFSVHVHEAEKLRYHRSLSNPPKCKEIIFRKKGFIQDIAQVNNIPQSTELPILGVTFQENCKNSEHVRAKLIKAN